MANDVVTEMIEAVEAHATHLCEPSEIGQVCVSVARLRSAAVGLEEAQVAPLAGGGISRGRTSHDSGAGYVVADSDASVSGQPGQVPVQRPCKHIYPTAIFCLLCQELLPMPPPAPVDVAAWLEEQAEGWHPEDAEQAVRALRDAARAWRTMEASSPRQ